jgi:Terminase large subunit, T4likevirus-type, N-terminal/Terminase RNaseH-like domain
MGRRWGKTKLGINRLTGPALDGKPVAWFSPSYRMLVEVWREIRQTLKPVIAHTNVQDRRIELITGGVLEFWSLDSPDVARGRKYRRIVIDEAAMIRELEDAWQAVIRPTLTDYEGDAWFFSTPKGRNFFWQLWQRGADPLQTDWASWQMPTTANPFINPAEVEAARRELPERTFAQEYLAAFLEDGGGVFRRVQDACTATPQDKPQSGHQYVLGIDWGRLEDFTVLSLIDVTTKEQGVVDRFNTIEYQTQLGRLKALYERFQPHAIIAEQNSIGVPLIEQMQRDSLPVQPFVTTNATKASAIDALALAFERGDLRILPDPVQTAELQAYEAERLPSGLMRYGAPPGQHDDTVMSLALAWQGCLTSGPLLLWGGSSYD